MDFIYSGIGKFLGWLDGLMGSYVLALFVFAIIVELLMLPLSIRQQKNTIKQAKLRPKEMAIRKKYAGRNDQPTQQKMSQEIQELYQREGYNMMGGCLPLLIQFPIIIILYRIVVNPLQYMMGMSKNAIAGLVDYAAAAADKGGLGLAVNSENTIGLIAQVNKLGVSAFEGIKSFASELEGFDGAAIYEELSNVFSQGAPNFMLFGLDLGATPSFDQFGWLWLIPALTFVVYYGSMKLNRKLTYQPTTANDPQVGCSNNIMDISMPIMSVFFTFMVPATIGVYWIFKSILSTLKQFIMTRVMPYPTFTEEDYKAAEKEMKGKSKGTPNRNYTSNGAKPRSLHHIDDDDELPAPAPKNNAGKKNTSEKPEGSDEETKATENNAPAPETENGAASLIAKAPLKEDDRKSNENDTTETK